MSFDSFNYAPPGCPPCVQFPNEPCNGCKDCEGNPPKRLKPRVETYWSDDIEDGMDMVEPVVSIEQKWIREEGK